MTDDFDPDPSDIATEIAALEQAMTEVTEIWRVILDKDGNELRRLFVGSGPRLTET